jgi:flagellar protein FliO/FliZ
MLGGVLQMAVALAVTVGTILVCSRVSRRWLKNAAGSTAGGGYIRLVETRYLAPKKALMLVEVGGEYLLLSDAAEGLRLIKEVNLLEEIEVVEEPAYAKLLNAGFPGRLQEMLRKLPRTGVADPAPSQRSVAS